MYSDKISHLEKADHNDTSHKTDGGERYRSVDPNISEALLVELISEHVDALPERGRARRDGSSHRLAVALQRINFVRIALGEQGPEWWKEMLPHHLVTRIVATIYSLLRSRPANGSATVLEIASIVDGRNPLSRVPLVIQYVAQGLHEQYLSIEQSNISASMELSSDFTVPFSRGENFDRAFVAEAILDKF